MYSRFTNILETSYTQYFLLEMGVTIVILSTASVIVRILIPESYSFLTKIMQEYKIIIEYIYVLLNVHCRFN